MTSDSLPSPSSVLPEATTSPHLSTLFAKALLIRTFEQRLLSLFAEGKLFGTVHTCIGQELTGVAVAEHLEVGDQVFSNHRCHGHYLARTDDVNGLMAEIMGKASGICGGRGGSQHICFNGFFSNGIQGGIAPVAAGLALAQKMAGSRNIVVVFIGDGTLGEGVLYETLNLVSKWQLPLLVVLENNFYAQSTSQTETLAGSICARAEAFGIEATLASTWDLEHLLATAASSVSRVRQTGKPMFLQIDTYRLMAHSKGDDDRDAAEVKGFWDRDLLQLFLASHESADELVRATDERIEAAVRRAESAPFADPGEGDPASSIAAGRRWRPAMPPSGQRRNVELIRDALERNMAKDERIVLIGEDIRSPYGGAFKATKGLSDLFPDRVRNAPISEAAIVGTSIGLAMSGLKPVCEIMFGDFLTLAADQIINHAAKFPYMYNEQVSIPLIIRTPMGGKRGYGPTHSQSLEKHFLGVPQTRLLAINARYDAGAVYDTLFETIDRPTIVIENKLVYALRAQEPPPGFIVEQSDELFPTLRIAPDGPSEVTILCYGGMLQDVEQAIARAFDDHEVLCEVICPLQLYPFDPSAVAASVSRTGRLLVIEEGLGFAAFGAEVIAQICEVAPGALKDVRRIGSPAHPIPSSGPLEKHLLPGVESVLRAIVEMTIRE